MNAQEDLDISLHDPIVVSSFYRVGVETIVREREIKKILFQNSIELQRIVVFLTPPEHTQQMWLCLKPELKLIWVYSV